MAAKGNRRREREEVTGWGWRTGIQLACILLPIPTLPFHLRAHQLSNWESDGDVRAAGISTRPEVGTPLRPNQNTITFTARTHSRSNTILCAAPLFFYFTQTLLDKCTYYHTHTQKKTLTWSHTWTNTYCPMQSDFGPFQTIQSSEAERRCIKVSAICWLISGYDPWLGFISIIQWLIPKASPLWEITGMKDEKGSSRGVAYTGRFKHLSLSP